MKIDKNVIDNINQQVSITLEKSDYQEEFNKALKKEASQVQLKGFRKGKTPASVIKKMSGQRILIDLVNNKLQGALQEYMKEHDLKTLGQPIPAEDQDQHLDFDPNNLEDYTFKFDLGLAPDFEIGGKETTYDILDVNIDEETLQKEIDHIRSQMGKQEEVEDDIEEKDILTIEAEELDGTDTKENGWATTFTVIVNSLTDTYQEALKGKKKGDTLEFDIYELEKDRKEDYVDKYLLNRGEEDKDVEIGRNFRGTVAKVMRLKKADFDQALWDKFFGEGEVSNEEEAKAKVEERIKSHFDEQAHNMMYKNIMDTMVDNTEMELPREFLKRWLILNNEKATAEDVEKEMDAFLQNLKWTLIKNKLTEEKEIQVQAEEIRQSMQDKVAGYFRNYGMDPSMASGVLEQMMQNQEEVNKTYEEILAGKLFESLGKEVDRNEQSVSVEEFQEKVKEFNSKHQVQ